MVLTALGLGIHSFFLDVPLLLTRYPLVCGHRPRLSDWVGECCMFGVGQTSESWQGFCITCIVLCTLDPGGLETARRRIPWCRCSILHLHFAFTGFGQSSKDTFRPFAEHGRTRYYRNIVAGPPGGNTIGLDAWEGNPPSAGYESARS